MLSALIVLYLVLVTASWKEQMTSPHRLGVLIALWAVGLIALSILVRGYRRE
jgi:hypothetical protein